MIFFPFKYFSGGNREEYLNSDPKKIRPAVPTYQIHFQTISFYDSIKENPKCSKRGNIKYGKKIGINKYTNTYI